MSSWHAADDELKAQRHRERSLLYGQNLSTRQRLTARIEAALTVYAAPRLVIGVVLVAIGAVISKFL
jgi:hypothetical protein